VLDSQWNDILFFLQHFLKTSNSFPNFWQLSSIIYWLLSVNTLFIKYWPI